MTGRIWKLLTSVRTSIGMMLVLCALLLLSVILPQGKYLQSQPDGIEGAAARNSVLDTLGMDSLGTSPVFLVFLGLFFLNLTVVLVRRVGVTLRRTRVRAPSAEVLRGWCERRTTLGGRASSTLRTDSVSKVLDGMGFVAVGAAEDVAWGVKHRAAPIGFLIFHLSFFLVCLGGVAIYLTRFVGASSMVEGQNFQGFTQVMRQAPLLAMPDLRFSVHDIEPRFEFGRALHLGAVFRLEADGRTVDRPARVNHPARLGASTLLVTRAGIAPVLWLQDSAGFTKDRVAVAAETFAGEPTVVDLDGGELRARIRPVIDQQSFPDRSELPRVALHLEVRDAEEQLLFEGAALIGQPVVLGDSVLVVQDLRFWVGVYVVREYGGGLLIAGFVLGTIGLIWRLMFYRREVAVVWEGSSFSVAGKAEYFSNRFRVELATLRDLLEE